MDVTEIVDERLAAWSAFADELGVRLEVEPRQHAWALATAGRLEQVLDNLLANALDATPDGSTITVSICPSETVVELHVADEGPGMTVGERERAFDRFWRAGHAKDGFGLGFAIVQRLVTADGGRAELRESAAGGLDAVVTLRRAEPSSELPRPDR